jgi:hypothetical protein
MDKSKIILQLTFVPGSNPSKVMQPRKEAFNLPSSFITPQGAPALGFGFPAIAAMRRDHLDTMFFQDFIQRIAVISPVANQSLGQFIDKDFGQSVSDKGDFMRRSRSCVDGERKTCAIRNCHELATLAPLGRSHSCAPFLATINVPSMKHSLRSKPPRSSRSAAKVSSTWRSVPSRTHCWNLLWQVWYGGKRDGRSYQRAPLRKIHKIPLRTSRSSRRGLPLIVFGLGNNGSISCHCSSLSSSRRGFLSQFFCSAVMQPVLQNPF